MFGCQTAALAAVGRLHLLENNDALAIDYPERALKLAPYDSESTYQLGVPYARNGRLEQGRELLRGAAGLRANYADPYYQLASFAFKQEEHDEALRLVEQADRLLPDFESIRFLKGRILQALGRTEEAKQEFEAASDLMMNVATHKRWPAQKPNGQQRRPEDRRAKRATPPANLRVALPRLLFRGLAGGKFEQIIEQPDRLSIQVRLEGAKSNRAALGAQVTAAHGDRKQTQTVLSQANFYSANDLRLYFGLGSQNTVHMEVRWLSGGKQMFTDVGAGQVVQIREGGKLEPMAGTDAAR